MKTKLLRLIKHMRMRGLTSVTEHQTRGAFRPGMWTFSGLDHNVLNIYQGFAVALLDTQIADKIQRLDYDI